MNFKKLFFSIALLNGFALCFSAQSNAFDISILKNDKEAVSRAYNKLDLHASKRRMGSVSEQAFKLLGDSLTALEAGGTNICDLELVTTLKDKLAQAGISNSHKNIVDLLIVWRSQDLIDDLFFEIMEQSSSFKESLLFSSVNTKTSSIAIKQANKFIKNKNVPSDALKSIYEDFNNFSVSNSGCSVEAWMNLSKNLGLSMQKKPAATRRFNVAAFASGALSVEAFELAEHFRVNEAQMWELNLNSYLKIVRSAKNFEHYTKKLDENGKPVLNSGFHVLAQDSNGNRILRSDLQAADSQPNVLSSGLIKDKKSKTTYRQALYARFSPFQIQELSNFYRDFLDLMQGKSAGFYVKDTPSGRSYDFPASPQRQYIMVAGMMQDQLNAYSYKNGVLVTHEDMLAAALETGLINNSAVEAALKIDDFWNPVIPPWKKIADFAFRVTGTATIFLPPPYNVVSSIVMVFINGLINRNANKRTASSLYAPY